MGLPLMAFDESKLAVSVDTIGGGSIRLHFYTTDDDLATVTGADYVAGAARIGMRAGDVVIVKSSTADGTFVCELGSINAAGAGTLVIEGVYASQAEAEAGVVNTRTMTPLRTNQAIVALGSTAAFTPSGSGAVARTVDAKLKEQWVSVFDYMTPALASSIAARTSVSGDGTATLTAIQAAIDANAGKIIYFPAGTYNVAGQINIRTARTRLVGEGLFGVLIQQRTNDVDTINIAPSSGSYIGNVVVRGLQIVHSGVVDASTTGAGIRAVQCSGLQINDVTVGDAPEGITLEGGQLNALKTFFVYASSGTAKGAGSALLHFKQADLGGGTYQTLATTMVEDFRLSAGSSSSNKLRESCIRIASADGLNFSNGYLNFSTGALLTVAFDRDNASISVVSFLNTYFDCHNTTDGTPTAILIPDDAYTSSTINQLIIGSGCFLGNASQYGILCTKPEVMFLTADGARFVNLKLAAFQVEAASGADRTDVLINGCQFQNCGTASTRVIRLNNGRNFTLTGNTFTDNVNLVLQTAGTWRTGTITGNSNAQSIADWSDTATYTGKLTVAGNTSLSTAAATSWLGVRTGNLAVTNPNTLDWYEEYTGTPTLTFGGASTGITYSNQTFRATRIGNRVDFNVRITLSSKGTATGAMSITLPAATPVAAVNTPVALHLNTMANDTGATMVYGLIGVSTRSMTFRKTDISGGTEVVSVLTDVDFANTSDLIAQGTYFV